MMMTGGQPQQRTPCPGSAGNVPRAWVRETDMWTVASWADGSETETGRMTFGEAVDLRDEMRAAGDFTAVVLEHFEFAR